MVVLTQDHCNVSEEKYLLSVVLETLDHHDHRHLLSLLEGLDGHIELQVLEAFLAEDIKEFIVLEVYGSSQGVVELMQRDILEVVAEVSFLGVVGPAVLVEVGVGC